MARDLALLTFIRRSIPSVWALDVLMLVRRPPPRTWSVGELVGELRASDAVVTGVLDVFRRDGLVSSDGDGRVRFSPAAEMVEQLVDALAQAYAERPVAVRNAIASTDADLKGLADAFRLDRRRP
ncbi:MAG TPA: hypothetical protein VHW05_12060 [Phenylobacterium sp.]|jgi:hypothetical protein|nr:hypothetical protein [Phenylobacterium sp.]